MKRDVIRPALLVGAAYFVVGRAFTWPTAHVGAWRLAAWLTCGALFVAHIGFEHVRLHPPPRALAAHASLAVAVGAFLLAVAGMIHSLSRTSTSPLKWIVALVAWPAITAIPAFLVALLATTLLARLERKAVAMGNAPAERSGDG